MITIDTTGLSCPQPVLMVRSTLDTLDGGSVTVLADCEASRENVTRCATSQGWEKTSESQNGEVWTMEFSKKIGTTPDA